MLQRLFIDHPRSLGESYGMHQRKALAFAWALLSAAIACFIHGIVPGVFASAASDAVTRLHDSMQRRQAARSAPEPGAKRAP